MIDQNNFRNRVTKQIFFSLHKSKRLKRSYQTNNKLSLFKQQKTSINKQYSIYLQQAKKLLIKKKLKVQKVNNHQMSYYNNLQLKSHLYNESIQTPKPEVDGHILTQYVTNLNDEFEARNKSKKSNEREEQSWYGSQQSTQFKWVMIVGYQVME